MFILNLSPYLFLDQPKSTIPNCRIMYIMERISEMKCQLINPGFCSNRTNRHQFLIVSLKTKMCQNGTLWFYSVYPTKCLLKMTMRLCGDARNASTIHRSIPANLLNTSSRIPTTSVEYPNLPSKESQANLHYHDLDAAHQ